MSKQLMISIKPEHAVNILNGKKTLELRTWIPKDYVGWINVYVSKSFPVLFYIDNEYKLLNIKNLTIFHDIGMWEFYNDDIIISGKVAFRFWFDEYSLLHYDKTDIGNYWYVINNITTYIPRNIDWLYDELCLSGKQVIDYGKGKDLYAWHIDKLEIFDKPKDLSEFGVKKSPQRSVWVYE